MQERGRPHSRCTSWPRTVGEHQITAQHEVQSAMKSHTPECQPKSAACSVLTGRPTGGPTGMATTGSASVFFESAMSVIGGDCQSGTSSVAAVTRNE